ncbi:hypothetical protein OEZ85_010268 [Tetradesmus obliquus]|uniref:peptidyl-tRNA hydrolase n=1 Tax=Tetradesmus obliquus TaxID=3088 RepID=A0ABY8TNX3_TETOB|nr:hypothetical protein OEZ85_010268 [Tetradesmus obliquus]
MDSTGDNGAIKFVAGLVLGAVIRSLAPGLFSKDDSKASSSSSQPRKKAVGVARPPTIPVPREELKMVLCVNHSLGMGKGKIGAQCAHAAVGVIGKYRKANEALFRMWERHGQPKIALKIQDEQHMAELAHKALQSGLPCYIVHDAGRTQIAAGSQTVLAIGPGYKSDIDRITGGLSLL